jgi:hypothetical protein
VEKLTRLAIIFFLSCSPVLLFAGNNNYAGAAGGFAILSADGRSQVGTTSAAVSQYKPETGSALNLFVGRHLSDYLSVQGNYLWNGNDLVLTAASFSSNSQAAYQESRTSSQHSFITDLLVYFRDRESWVRPYLSAGVGCVHLSSTQRRVDSLSGGAVLPPWKFSDTVPGLRVAVGADLKLRHGWKFRYSFSETMSPNAISDQLSPPGQGSLKNFQNLFGFVMSF